MRHQRRLIVVGAMIALMTAGIASVTTGNATWVRVAGSLLISLGAAVPAWVAIGSARQLRRRLDDIERLIVEVPDGGIPSAEISLLDHRTRAILEALAALRVGPITTLEESVQLLTSLATTGAGHQILEDTDTEPPGSRS